MSDAASLRIDTPTCLYGPKVARAEISAKERRAGKISSNKF
jgi:hypothetical protein